MRTNPIHHAVVLLLLGASVPSQALEFKPADGVDASVSTTATLGTMIRTGNPDSADYALIPSTQVAGTAPGQLVGQTGGSDLNFARGHAVSTVLKALVDVDVHTAQGGAFVSASAWHDFALGHDGVRYGNYSNGFTPDAPAGDRDLDRSARFSGAQFLDAYAYGHADVPGAGRVDVRLGRQVLNWGPALFVTGGVNSAINPVDYAGQLRPGALPEEGKVPLAMLDAKLAGGGAWSTEGFVAFESRHAVLPGCGTFFDISSPTPHGCRFTAAFPAPIPGTPLSTMDSLTERNLLQSGYYLHRADDVPARAGGQFGLALHVDLKPWQTRFSAYAMNTHSAMPSYRMIVEDVNGGTLPAGVAGALQRLADPDGLKYATMYAQDVRLFGASFDKHFGPAAKVYGELAYRPNQPIGMNPNDLLLGFLLRAPTSLMQLDKDILAIPAGGTFDGFDRFHVTTLSLGTVKVVPKALGADRWVLAAEFGASHVAGLPDPSVMRYGRPLAYGSAPYRLPDGSLTPCSEAAPGLSGVPGKTCTTDGFVTRDASGVRARVAATFGRALFGATLTPSLLVGLDLDGYSYDGTFNQGRRLVRAGLRADWGTSRYVDVQYSLFGGGRYNLLADRSNVAVAAGVKF